MSAPAAPTALPGPTAPGRGVAYGLGAYLLWGLLPAYFVALRPAGPWEILAHRIVWSLAFCLLILLVRGRLRTVTGMLRRPRELATVALAAALISVNWLTYLIAVTSGRITEGALGYFLNPLVSIALGMVLLRERLRRAQAVAALIGLCGAVYLAVAARTPSWIAATLAVSFGLYGLVKKRVTLEPVPGLTVETAVLTPVALLVLLLAPGGSTFTGHGPVHAGLLVGMGVATAVPLILFAAAAHRLPLVLIGLMQFVAPVLQFVYGLAVGEQMTPHRWIGFAVVWVALLILVVDSVRRVLPGRATAGGTPPTTWTPRPGPR